MVKYDCPDSFKEYIKNLEPHELAELLRDLAMHPQDIEYVDAVVEELKRRK